MRYIRYICIALFGLALIAIAVANRASVTLKVLPDEIADLFAVNPSVELPLFVVIFGGILAGILVGFIWEWVREHKFRAEATTKAREVRRLEREVEQLKGKEHEGKDDVLALIDKAS